MPGALSILAIVVTSSGSLRVNGKLNERYGVLSTIPHKPNGFNDTMNTSSG